ncbi:hypothetical protein P7H79_05790 [Lactococcus lactis]|uniref:hypothetical protein n=1 Tax=Lactococcus lactis TaxID=1358 RepID=UPI00288CCCB1|nr:hypothetical protein [Lactococcus lactis]MDT2872880.1 hypothetical protein [Lactococcus lactis]MDT2934717.1 hypothetical protein [Lactococcus lactis]
MFVKYLVLVASKAAPNDKMSLDNKLAIWAIVISILAILVSAGTVIWQGCQERKRQKIDLKSLFYKDIYWEYLIKKIPESRNFVKHSAIENKITGTDKITDELNNIRRDSLFFKFTDKTFYDGICEKLENLEDKYVKADKMILAKYNEFNKEVDIMLTEIYDMITSKYTGTSN